MRRFILQGIKKSFIYSLVSLVLILVVSLIFSFIKGTSFLKLSYTLLYALGAFSSIFSVSYFFKKDEDPKIALYRRKNPLFGFYSIFDNPYAERAELESIEEFKGEGFWIGVFIVLYSILILIFAVLVEKIYY